MKENLIKDLILLGYSISSVKRIVPDITPSTYYAISDKIAKGKADKRSRGEIKHEIGRLLQTANEVISDFTMKEAKEIAHNGGYILTKTSDLIRTLKAIHNSNKATFNVTNLEGTRIVPVIFGNYTLVTKVSQSK